MTEALYDTSAVIDPPSEDADGVYVSVLTLAEIEAGVLLASTLRARSDRMRKLRRVHDTFESLPVDDEVARRYALIVAACREAKRTARVMDTLIAATAQAYGLVLWTRDRAQAALPGVDAVVLGPRDATRGGP